jgi:hypothetical protein
MVFKGRFATVVVPQPALVFTQKCIRWNNTHSYVLFTSKVCPARRHDVTMTMIVSVAIVVLPCTGADIIDLATIASPYTGSTAGNADDVSICGSGPDQGFALLLEPGAGLRISLTSSSFHSAYMLRHGGGYPGSSEVPCSDTEGYTDSLGYNCSSHIGYDCLDEELYSDLFGYALEDWQDMVASCPASCGLLCGCAESTGVTQTFVNNWGDTDAAVYFIVDGKTQSSSGNFTLGWQILKYASCNATEIVPNAADIGDCQGDLPHGVTCHQTGMVGYTCSASTCQDGTLAEGRCNPTSYCSILTLGDSYGDGWDTGTLSFRSVETGRIIFSALTLSEGLESTTELCFPCGCFMGQGIGGGYPEEMFWSLHEPVANAMLASGVANEPSGSFCPVSSFCSRCGAGSFSNSEGTACKSCTPGRYNGEEWSAVQLCAECSPGRYNVKRGSTSETDCLHCAAGHYSPPGASECVPGSGVEDIAVLQSIAGTLGVNIWGFPWTLRRRWETSASPQW